MEVPALKQRREDIPTLAKYFLEKSTESAGMQIKCLSDEARHYSRLMIGLEMLDS